MIRKLLRGRSQKQIIKIVDISLKLPTYQYPPISDIFFFRLNRKKEATVVKSIRKVRICPVLSCPVLSITYP
jgi:hypothetical protein